MQSRGIFVPARKTNLERTRSIHWWSLTTNREPSAGEAPRAILVWCSIFLADLVLWIPGIGRDQCFFQFKISKSFLQKKFRKKWYHFRRIKKQWEHFPSSQCENGKIFACGATKIKFSIAISLQSRSIFGKMVNFFGLEKIQFWEKKKHWS